MLNSIENSHTAMTILLQTTRELEARIIYAIESFTDERLVAEIAFLRSLLNLINPNKA